MLQHIFAIYYFMKNEEFNKSVIDVSAYWTFLTNQQALPSKIKDINFNHFNDNMIIGQLIHKQKSNNVVMFLFLYLRQH